MYYTAGLSPGFQGSGSGTLPPQPQGTVAESTTLQATVSDRPEKAHHGPMNTTIRASWRRLAASALFALILLLWSVIPPLSGAGAASPGYQAPWTWPLHPVPPVARPFDPPPEPWLSGHRGVDLRAAAGTEVLSPAAGVVSFVGKVVNRPVISINHGGGLLSSFEPVSSRLRVGDKVAKGQPIGTLSTGDGTGGNAGNAPHCPFDCVHWGVRLNRQYVDPLPYVQDRRPSVLLPVPPP